jgi:hypothetical protein
MTLRLLVGVAVNKTIDTTSTNSGSGNATALFSSPGSRILAGAEGLDSTSNQSGLRSLSPLAFGTSLRSAAAAAVFVRIVATAMTWSGSAISVTTGVTISRPAATAGASCYSGGDSSKSKAFQDLTNTRLAAFCVTATGRGVFFWVVVAVMAITVTATVLCASGSISSTSGGCSGYGNLVIIIVIVIVSAAGLATGTAGWRVVVVFSSSSTGSVTIAWGRGKVSGDVFDAFVARAVDQIARRRALAALDIGCFLDELGITAFAGSGAGLAVAAAIVVCAVVGHGIVVGRGAVEEERGRLDRQHSVKVIDVVGVTSLTRVAGSGLGFDGVVGELSALTGHSMSRCVYCKTREKKNKIGIASRRKQSRFTGSMSMRDREGRSVKGASEDWKRNGNRGAADQPI